MTDNLNVLEAKYQAQKLAFGPFFFQAMIAMRDLGILEEVGKSRKGVTLEELSEKLKISIYGVKILMEAGLVSGIFKETDQGKFKLTKVGFFIKTDEMTKVNINFTNDICYKGLAFLKDSIQEEKASGLHVFGDYKNIYHGLKDMPDYARKSWFEFDHYYSDDSFPYALDIVYKDKVDVLLDIGGNTGKWAINSCKHNPDVHIKILDLPGQLTIAQQNLENSDFKERVSFHPIDILDQSTILPEGADVIWMSQFLDCFSFDEILSILQKVYQAAKDDTDIYIMEPCWNNQKYEAAKYSVVAISLYFTCMANGNSKMFHLDEILDLVGKANFEVVETFPLIGNTFNTLLKIRKKK